MKVLSFRRVPVSLILVFALAACSSGGGSDATPVAVEPTPVVPQPDPAPDPGEPTTPDPQTDVDDFDFPVFESGQVRPLALSADGLQLYAVNTPDNRLEIYSVGDSGLLHQQSVDVGMEPVSVAVHNSGAVWVVNHLSDSVSIIDVNTVPAAVMGTLLVGDEPRDLVFAGPGFNRAFVSVAHRGQNAPFDPQLKSPGVGRADVWVFDTVSLDLPNGGTPSTWSLVCSNGVVDSGAMCADGNGSAGGG